MESIPQGRQEDINYHLLTLFYFEVIYSKGKTYIFWKSNFGKIQNQELNIHILGP